MKFPIHKLSGFCNTGSELQTMCMMRGRLLLTNCGNLSCVPQEWSSCFSLWWGFWWRSWSLTTICRQLNQPIYDAHLHATTFFWRQTHHLQQQDSTKADLRTMMWVWQSSKRTATASKVGQELLHQFTLHGFEECTRWWNSTRVMMIWNLNVDRLGVFQFSRQILHHNDVMTKQHLSTARARPSSKQSSKAEGRDQQLLNKELIVGEKSYYVRCCFYCSSLFYHGWQVDNVGTKTPEGDAEWRLCSSRAACCQRQSKTACAVGRYEHCYQFKR